MPGMGAVASTLIAGVMQARNNDVAPIGSVTQMAHIRLGKREENRNPLIRDFVPLAGLDDIVFGGWDPISPNMYEAARTAGVMSDSDSGCHVERTRRHRRHGCGVRTALGVTPRRCPGKD